MTETINRIASVWFDWQWAMLWQVAILIGVVAVIDRLIRKRAWPQLRYALWLLVLVKLVLPPTLTSPLSLTSQIPAWAQEAVAAGTSSSFPPANTQATRPSPGAAGVPSVTGGATVAGAVTADTAKAQGGSPAEPAGADVWMRNGATEALSGPATALAAAPALSWTVYVLGIWLVGVVTLAAGLHIRLRQMAKEHAGTQTREVPAWFGRLLVETASELGLRRVPQVMFSNKVCCPAVFGVFRPVLLFPAEQVPMTQREGRHILLHELAHIRRGDLLVHACYMVLVTVYWFNPLLWLIRRHIQNLRELCCDATVAAHLKEETAAYRETLLAAGRALLAHPVDPGLGLLGLFENSGWLLVRLQWLERKTWRHPWLRRTLVATVIILMLCCIVPMASVQAAPGQTFAVTLRNGSTFELIGVRKTGTSEWWRPDGKPLPEAPYDTSEGTNRPNAYEFALRYGNLPENPEGAIDIDNHRCGGDIPMPETRMQKAGKPVKGMTYVVAEPPQGTETTAVRVCLSGGPWTADGPDARYYRHVDGWKAAVSASPTFGAAAFAVPYEREGKTCATLFYSTYGQWRYDVRLTAVDVNNMEHPPGSESGSGSPAGMSLIQAEFDLPLDDIAAFNGQIRPVTRVEFRNVSLRPGGAQQVEIITTEPNLPDEHEARDKSKTDINDVRATSVRVLKAFHTTCTRYLEENKGKELPPRPWALEFKLGEHESVAPADYVTSEGYFGVKGFPSLRREHFESSAAARTPILYCKWLLKAENGKGTNVLFGDGHIEWVTAEELERLKAASQP
jgi:prepilin-type processing-associated H-X9-DG protein